MLPAFMRTPREITRMLAYWSSGDQAALDKLLPLVYDELRRLASNYMRRERPDHLLQTTALVHEAYLRLVEQQNVNCPDAERCSLHHARPRTAGRGGGVMARGTDIWAADRCEASRQRD